MPDSEKQDGVERSERTLQQVPQEADRAGEAAVLVVYADALLSDGNPMAAIVHYKAALQIGDEPSDKATRLHIFNRLGMAAHLLRDIPQAVGYYAKMLQIARETGDKDAQALALHNIGGAHHVAGEIALAMSHYQEAMALNVPGIAYKCALGLGQGCLQIGKSQEARGHFARCIRLLCDLDRLSFHPEVGALGVSLLAVGRTEEGLELYRRGLELRPSREGVNYAIEDLRFLEGVDPPIRGVAEAIAMLVRELTAATGEN